ncbi:MAG: hypothetical protein ABEJ91_03415 [Candidatus Nanohaloarchaea archaeon]
MMDSNGLYQLTRRSAKRVVESDSFRLFVVLLLFFAVFAHWVGYNETSRLDLTRSIVEEGDFDIDEYAYNTNDKSKISGHFYSDKAPLPAFAAVPSYMLVDAFVDGAEKPDYYLLGFSGFLRTNDFKTNLARLMAVVTVSGVSGALAGVLYFKIFELAGLLGREQNMLLAGLGGLGTHVFPYSTTFHGTMLGTTFLLLSTYLWLSAEEITGRRAFLMAGSLGLGVSASYLVAIPGTVLLLVAFRERIAGHFRNRFQDFSFDNALVYGFAGGLAGLLPLLAYNTAIFGHPFDLTMFYNTINKAALEAARNSLGNPSVFGLEPGLMLSRAARLLLSPGYGLLVFSPVLAFAFYGLWNAYHRRKDLVICISASLGASLLFVSSLSAWGNGAMYGARYLLPASSLLFLATPWAVRKLSRHGKMLFGGVSLVSIFISLLSTQTWSDLQVGFSRQHELMLSLQPVYEYLYRDYLPGFHREALASPVMSYLTGFTQSLNMVIGPSPDRTLVLGSAFEGLVIVSDSFLWVSLCSAVAVLVFRDEIREVVGERAPRLLLLVIGLLLLAGFSSSQLYFDGSYPKLEKEDVRWGRQSPEINIYSDAETTEKYLLRFALKSPGERQVSVKLNGKNVSHETVGPETEFAEIVSLVPGRNRISFETGECTVLGRINNNNDVRCVTVGISDFRINRVNYDGVVEGTNIRERNGSYVLAGNATLFIGGGKNYSIEMEGKAIGKATRVTVYVGERNVSSTVFPLSGSEFATPYFSTGTARKVTIQTRCSGECERLELAEFRLRTFQEQPNTTLYRFGRNWYQKLEGERYRWSHGNSSIMLYNYRDRPAERILWIQGRSFGTDRNITYVFNGEKLDTRAVPSTAYMLKERDKLPDKHVPNKHGFKVTLKPGENILEIRSPTGCMDMGEVNQNQDIRCSLFGLEKLYLTEEWS